MNISEYMDDVNIFARAVILQIYQEDSVVSRLQGDKLEQQKDLMMTEILLKIKEADKANIDDDFFTEILRAAVADYQVESGRTKIPRDAHQKINQLIDDTSEILQETHSELDSDVSRYASATTDLVRLMIKSNYLEIDMDQLDRDLIKLECEIGEFAENIYHSPWCDEVSLLDEMDNKVRGEIEDFLVDLELENDGPEVFHKVEGWNVVGLHDKARDEDSDEMAGLRKDARHYLDQIIEEHLREHEMEEDSCLDAPLSGRIPEPELTPYQSLVFDKVRSAILSNSQHHLSFDEIKLVDPDEIRRASEALAASLPDFNLDEFKKPPGSPANPGKIIFNHVERVLDGGGWSNEITKVLPRITDHLTNAVRHAALAFEEQKTNKWERK